MLSILWPCSAVGRGAAPQTRHNDRLAYAFRKDKVKCKGEDIANVNEEAEAGCADMKKGQSDRARIEHRWVGNFECRPLPGCVCVGIWEYRREQL